MRNVVVSVLLCLFSTCGFAQESRHPFTFDDLVKLREAAPVAVSPDGKSILYRVHFGAQKGMINTEWNLIAPTGGDSRHLSIPEKFQPRGFTRDGSALYGTYNVGKATQLATLALAPAYTPAAAAATPVPLTGLPRGNHSDVISPDG